MNIEHNLNTDQSKLVVLGAGIALAFIVWFFTEGRVEQLRYLEVYGEVVDSEVVPQELGKLEALPLVEAVGSLERPAASDLNELAIEAAFREPVFTPPAPVIEEEVAETRPVSTGPTLVEQFLIRYRPLVGAISSNGVVISGNFWRFGESLENMPMSDGESSSDTPEMLYPRLVGVRNGSVILKLGDQEVPVKFERL